MKAPDKRISVALFIAALVILARFSGLYDLLTLDNLRQYRAHLLAITTRYYLLSAGIFVASYVAVTALSIPGAALLSLAAGFLFGFWGLLYVNIGATLGAVLAFLAARYLIGDWLQKRYAGRLASFNYDLAENGYHYLLTLRLIPLFPFFLVNILAGITRTYTWTTMVGIAPASVVYIYAGRQLGSINKPGDIISWPVVLAFGLFGLLAASPVILKKLWRGKNRANPC